MAESLEACGFTIRSQIVWAKSRLVLGRGDYHWQHEPCFYAVREGKIGHWQGARDQTTLWSIATRGDAIYEPFSGSGTTLIAAETTGRRCLAMEIDPAYCDVAVQRWQDLTGKTE